MKYKYYGCSGLTSVIIPNSVTRIERSTFYHCSGLTSVTIGNSVTRIGEDAFFYCFGLKKVIVKDIAAWCGIMFDDFDSNPLHYAEHIYSDEDTEITNLIIPNSVTSIGYCAFSHCSGLTSVTIPNSVTSIRSYAFSCCFGLTSITIPNSVTSIGYCAFSGCTGLTSVTIPNSVTSIGEGAFSSCKGLTSVTIPNSVTSIGDDAFSICIFANENKKTSNYEENIISYNGDVGDGLQHRTDEVRRGRTQCLSICKGTGARDARRH